MEGNGPLAGETVNANLIVMGNNLSAVDATATRLMGLRPEKISYLEMLGQLGEPLAASDIKQRGETITSTRRAFKVLPKFAELQES